MNREDKEIEETLGKLVKLGLMERRTVNGEIQFKITQLGERYVELNLLPKSGGEE